MLFKGTKTERARAEIYKDEPKLNVGVWYHFYITGMNEVDLDSGQEIPMASFKTVYVPFIELRTAHWYLDYFAAVSKLWQMVI